MKRERAIAIGLLVVCAVAGILTTGLDKSTMDGEPGPKFYPTIIIILLAVLSLILLAKPRMETKRDDEFSTREALAFFGVFLFGLAAMYFVGFVPSMVLALTVMTFLAGWKIPKSLVFSIVVMVSVYLIFDRLLEIPLPMGLFFLS